MSIANKEYILANNPLLNEKVEVNPNSIELYDYYVGVVIHFHSLKK